MDRKELRAIGTKKRPLTTGRNDDDPTPEEIRAHCLEIQSGWSEFTRRSRSMPERPVDLGNVHRIVEVDDE